MGHGVILDGHLAGLAGGFGWQHHESEGSRVVPQEDNGHTIGWVRRARSGAKHAWGVSNHDLVGVSVINKGNDTR